MVEGFVNIWYEFDAESGVGILAKRVNADGTLGNPNKIINSEHPIPESFNVAVYPNPFNDNITIKLWLSKSEDVEISVYTIQGRLVKNIYKGKQKANFKKYFWNSTNQDLTKVSSGLYIIRVKSGNFFLSKKVILIR